MITADASKLSAEQGTDSLKKAVRVAHATIVSRKNYLTRFVVGGIKFRVETMKHSSFSFSAGLFLLCACTSGSADPVGGTTTDDQPTASTDASGSAGTAPPSSTTDSEDESEGSEASTSGRAEPVDPAFELVGFEARYEPELDALILEIETVGDAGSVAPEAVGSVDGAPVLGYVFPTTLSPESVGFSGVDGDLVLAVTSHPDFDDTPLWDEDGNLAYDDDGVVYHAHWAVLVPDDRAPAGLAVAQAPDPAMLPPTAPMPMYLDSPGFTVVEDGTSLRVVVPLDRIGRALDFDVGALTAQMRVEVIDDAPLLGVEAVFSALDEGAPTVSPIDLELAAPQAWPDAADDAGTLDVTATEGTYRNDVETFVMTIDTASAIATSIPQPSGALDGAPVLGYVFPTSIDPSEVGFEGATGILALAVTSHPDFDDTPLWDESLNGEYADDGGVYHVHWAVLVEDADSAAGLSVPPSGDTPRPPTSPMPMLLDSPGFHAFARGERLTVLIPGWHLPNTDAFNFDALTASMRVDASGLEPTLRVEEVHDILSGDLSLPNTVSRD